MVASPVDAPFDSRVLPPFESRAAQRVRGTWRHAVPSLVGVVLALTACSGGEDGAQRGAVTSSPSVGSSVTAPGATTSPAGSGATPAGDVAHLASASDLAQVMTAAMRAAGTAKLTLVVKSGGPSIEGTGAVRTGDDPAIQLATTVGGRLVKVRVVDGQAYVSPGMSLRGKSWLKIDAGTDNPMATAFGTVLSALRGVTGASAAATGFDRASSFKNLGPRTVNGVPAHEYVVVLEEEALRSVMSATGEGSGQPDLTGARATYTLSLDDAARPVRIATRTTSTRGTVENITDYRAWGEPVTINPPPADQVMDVGK